jgi:hypothetical protein
VHNRGKSLTAVTQLSVQVGCITSNDRSAISLNVISDALDWLRGYDLNYLQVMNLTNASKLTEIQTSREFLLSNSSARHTGQQAEFVINP